MGPIGGYTGEYSEEPGRKYAKRIRGGEGKYYLKQPVKNAQSFGYWLFVTVTVSFLVWIMLINPLTMPADKMPFIFAYDPKTHKVTDPAKQKREYAIWTGGAMLTAAVVMIPFLRAQNRWEYVHTLIYTNSRYLTDDQMEDLTKNLKVGHFTTNAKEILLKLDSYVAKNKGKDFDAAKYGFLKKKPLQKVA